MEDRIAQHLDLAGAPVARVHLDRAVVGAQRRASALDLGPAPMSAYLPAPARGNAPAAIGAPEAAPAEMPNATPQGRIQERLRMVADERPDALVGLMHGWLREEDHRR